MLLKLQNIGKIYDSNNIFTIGIRNINLEFDRNEFVIIEGESGSGKSTLLNVIGANDTYEEGELYINGEETSHYSNKDWEKYREQNIATVFQDFNIIENLTVLENVELALLNIENRSRRKKRASELIGKVGLTKQINQRGSKLSGGEKQRTVIARALAKDSPIILADEPTGNLDVKASREIAALLKEVAEDKLVIVVTHNPEFFEKYATRRVKIFDGGVLKDDMISKFAASGKEIITEVIHTGKRQNLKNTLYLGVLNYKSRPKFTLMMSFALIICVVTLFLILSIFNRGVIEPLKTDLESYSVEGKVLITAGSRQITVEQLDEIAGKSNAGFFMLDRSMAEFTINIPKKSGMIDKYDIVCLYSPYQYNLAKGEAVLVLPQSAKKDADAIRDIFLKADAGIETITVKSGVSEETPRLYLSYDDLEANGLKLRAINSTMKLGENKWTVFTYETNDKLDIGQVCIINSMAYEAENLTAVFSVDTTKFYEVFSASEKRDDISGIIIQMSPEDYDDLFVKVNESANHACLYFSNNEKAAAGIKSLPAGYIGLLSNTGVYVKNADNTFIMNILYYIALVAISICLGALISLIFGRSVRIYQTDFTVYRTLGISRKISSNSLYIQMALIFLPSLFLLPLISYIAAIMPGSTLPFISFGNYIFIELMILIIVECVAFGFNKSINGQSIRKSLKRGSK